MNDKNNSSRKKILLAEDDSSMRHFIEVILQKENYDVFPAEDGLSAMKTVLSEKFDAVVSDAVMPNLTGHELCRILRQNSDFDSVPLIILSGLEQDIASNAENNCANLYLLKGANLKEELTENLSKLLSNNAQV
ncbi:MAG: response regulator [Pyrinomonadaceae bacterium]